MDASRLERAARALLDAASRIEAETMCVVPRRLVDALRAALAAQPAQAGEAPASHPSAFCTRLMVPVDDPSHPNPEDWRAGCPGPHTPRKAPTHPAPERAGEAVGHVHEWDYDCRGNGPFCKLCGAGPSRPSGAPAPASAEAYAQGVIDGQKHERSLAHSAAPASAEAVAREAARTACEQIAGSPVLLTSDAVDAIVDRAVAHALRAQRNGGAA